jgi:hypothetical protein
MVKMNFIVILLTALVPIIVGFVWYHPKVLGTAWMQSIGKTQDSIEKENAPNMVKILGFVYLFSLMFCFIYQFLCIHQFGAFGMIGGDETKALPSYTAFMNDYVSAFRTFKHGALHGGMSGLMLSFAFIGVSAMFENRGWKYLLIHVGYWTITGLLVGGILCQFNL